MHYSLFFRNLGAECPEFPLMYLATSKLILCFVYTQLKKHYFWFGLPVLVFHVPLWNAVILSSPDQLQTELLLQLPLSILICLDLI